MTLVREPRRTRAGRRVAATAAVLGALLPVACAESSSEPSAPIATAGVETDTSVGEAGDAPAVVEIRAVLSTTVGSCTDVGVGMRIDGRRCHVLGDAVDIGGTSGVSEWVSDATAVSRGDFGWVVRVGIRPDAFAAVRDAFETIGADRYVLVADGRGMVEFAYTALAQESAFGPLLSEREAGAVAAVLRGEPFPELTRPVIEAGETWVAAVGVHICGEWLANAPVTETDAAVHSHGDGLAYVHPVEPSTDPNDPNDPNDSNDSNDFTLGRFLATGGWSASEDELRLWDGATHTDGGTCPDGRSAAVRWTVDGEEGSGDPGDHRIGHRQVIVLSFDPIATDPGEPPQFASLPVPTLGPDFAPAGG